MFKLTPVIKPHFYLVGCGGTGGFCLETLARLLLDTDATVDVYDGDRVEAKNLKRQNFAVADLGKNKAQVLADRLTENLPENIQINVHPEYLTTNLATDWALLPDNETPIVISAVDNIATRRLINGAVADLARVRPVIALDSGCHDQGGQVVVWSNKPAVKQDLTKTSEVTLQSMLALLPEIDKIESSRDENPGLVTDCADESNSKPQAMMANIFAGNLLASLAFDMSQNRAIAHNFYQVNLAQGIILGFDR